MYLKNDTECPQPNTEGISNMKRTRRRGFWKNISIRYTIFLYFTISALVVMLLSGEALYMQMSHQLSVMTQEESQAVLGQVNRSVDSYLRTIMKLSDSLYYGVIKNADLSAGSINSQITLLYDNNKDSIANIALLSKEGELLEAVPAARLKTDLDVTEEEWFGSALKRTDNLHFTTPHVQYIFDNNEQQYRWVITLTRAVEITHGTSADQGKYHPQCPAFLKQIKADEYKQEINNTDSQKLKKSFSCIACVGIVLWKLHLTDKQIQNLYYAEKQIKNA